MPKAPASSAPVDLRPKRPTRPWQSGILLAGGVIVLATWAAYANSFSAPFVFDDLKSIAANPSIRHLWPLSEVLSPPNNLTGAAGRPVVNLSLAINYALGGVRVNGYHVFNTLVHALAGLTLFGIVRRTLLRPALRGPFGAAALPLALVVALLWVLHPLQTESVTCVVQRSESLMGLFYLLTLYGFIRSVESSAPLPWQIFTLVACVLGMATKEVMISAPLMVLLYDRTFVAGTFRAAWQQRSRLYVGLAVTAGLLIWLSAHSSQRGGNAGFGLGVSPWEYALTQCQAIVHYLRLSVWPHPLVVDYGTTIDRRVEDVWPQGLLLVALVAATFVALRRRPILGFLGFWFFAILAPSSSVIPLISQTIAEHRMYLPVAAVIALAMLAGYRWLGQRVLIIGVALAVAAGWLTALRNRDYRDPLTLWSVTVGQQPDNARAQMNLGTVLLEAGRLEEAHEHFAAAVRVSPAYAETHFNLANVLLRLDRRAEALAAAEEAVRLKPGYTDAHYLLGTVLLKERRVDEAIEEYRTALRLRPDFADAHHTLAGTFAMTGRMTEALEQYDAALRLQPDNPLLHQEMANLHYRMGNDSLDQQRFAEAVEHYVAALRLRPEAAPAHNNLGNALVELGRLEEAQVQFEEALRLKPDYETARNNLERLRAMRASGNAR